MYQKLLDEKIFVELTGFVKDNDEEVSDYCEFMRGIILNTSGIN